MTKRKSLPLLKIMNASLVDLPAPSNITHLWNFGSLLGMCLSLQILTGIFLAMHYSSNIMVAFNCVDHIMRDIWSGWLIRLLHANGASLFFMAIYVHIGRGLYFRSFTLKMTWSSGITIFLISMLTAFLGYVLPWGQMSYWGATVITNLLSAVPYIGVSLVEWVWGGFSVSNSTLGRFFSLHYLFPFIILFLVIMHLVFLHENKSSNPLGMQNSTDKIPFHPYFLMKDLTSMLLIFIVFIMTNLSIPFFFMDPDNFTPANPLVTPAHIQPEWYFLFAYAILRAVPNKLGGVVALLMSIMILFIFLFTNKKTQHPKSHFQSLSFWTLGAIFLFLTWLGMKPVEEPYLSLSMIFTLSYFSWFLFL
uniref:Cytochrome b n=1 Tax=Hypsibius dujardini TaxID=232323 RepID=E7BBB8_HYPDU|nr:cytochrome b [Hypsibius dujardini]CBY83899.1 cyrochrome B [Hypsibius dujardini]